MQRRRFPSLQVSRLLAAAVVMECCARLCPAVGSRTGPTLGTAVPCAHPGTTPGEHSQTDPEQGAGTGWVPMPEVLGRLRTQAELLPFPGTPTELPSPQGSPAGPQAGEKGTGPVGQDGPAPHGPGPHFSAGVAEQAAAAGSARPGPAPGPMELDKALTTLSPPSVTAKSATATQGIPSHSPNSAMVPSSAGVLWGSPITLPGQSPTGLGIAQRHGGSHSPSSPDPRAVGDPAATGPQGTSPRSRLSLTPATDNPVPGTMGTSPVVERLLSSAGTLQGTRPGRGWGSEWHGTDIAWQGPRSALHPSLPFLGPHGYGGLLASTAQPATGTGPASLPATGKGSGLPVPTAMAGTLGVTSPGPGGALDLTTRVLGPPGTESPPERGHGPLGQTLVALGSTVAGQSSVSYTGPGALHVPRSRQPDPTGDSVPMSPTPQHLPGTSQGVSVLSPTVGTPLAEVLRGTPVAVSDSKPWAATDSPSAPGSPQMLTWSQPASSLRLTTTVDVTITTNAAATTSPALPGDMGTVTPDPGAALLQGDATDLPWGLPTPLPTMMPAPPQQPTDPPGTLGHHVGPGSPRAAGDTDLVQPSGSPRAWLDGDTPQVTLVPAGAGRAPQVFIVEDQPPLLKVSLLRIPCELVLDMRFSPALQDPGSPEHQDLLHSFNHTVAPLFMSVPGFLRLEVTGIREGSVVLQYDALFAAEQVRVPGLGALLEAALGSGAGPPGGAVGMAPVLRNVALARPLDPCAVLFTCRAGFTCVSGADGNVTCTSLCHRHYCKNHGICTHLPGRQPLCQCPVGSDFWFMGLRCDYRVTQQSLLGMAAGVLLSIVLLGAVLAAIAIRRFKVLLLEARADQTQSSYRRFCRLDDVSAQYWSRSWLPSASSLDNPAFSNSEELLHLQILDNGCCSCREGSGTTGSAKQRPALPARPPSFQYDWDTSSSSMNDPMVDSGKASDISVSSWPMEPIPWTPFPLLHQLSRQRPHKGRRPHSYCEGMELATLERSWTA